MPDNFIQPHHQPVNVDVHWEGIQQAPEFQQPDGGGGLVVAGFQPNGNVNFGPIERVGLKPRRKLPEREKVKLTPFEELPVGNFKRGLPMFCPKYDTPEEVQMRLRKSIVCIKGKLYVVMGASVFPKDGVHVTGITLWADGTTYYVDYNDKLEIDVRPIGPRYIQTQAGAGYLTRLPRRKVQQGLNEENAHVVLAGPDQQVWEINIHDLLNRLTNYGPVKWSDGLRGMVTDMNSLKLSDNVAVGTTGKEWYVDYKGRKLGLLENDCVLMDEMDAEMSFIHKDLHDVHLRAK